MTALLGKELRALWPLWALSAFAISGDLIGRPFYQRVDELSWLSVTELGADGTDLGVMLGLLALTTAFSAFPREHDEGTIHYLYALPVSRVAILGAKATAGLVVMWSVVLLGACTNWLLQSQNPQTFSGGQWSLAVAAPAITLRLGVVTCFYGYGILASWLRRFGMALIALGAITLIKLEGLDPALGDLNPINLVRYRYHGQELLVPWDVLAAHLASALACLGLGGLLWMRHADGVTAWFADAQDTRWRRWLLRLGTLAAFGLGMAALGISVDPPPDGGEQGVSFELAKTRSQHFLFVYDTAQRRRALPLIRGADDDWRHLQAQLGVGDVEGMMVDLTDASQEHDGVAAWSKARVSLANIDDGDYGRFVLVHELAHIAQQRASHRRLNRHAASTGFFVEGMAQWVAHERVPLPGMRELERLVAVESLSRQHVPFEALADRNALRTLVPPTADYLIGELFTQALVDHCGPDALRRLLASFAREDAPKQLSGAALWRDTLQAMRCDLSGVIQAQVERVASLRAAHRDRLETFPRVSGGVTNRTPREVELQATLDRDLPEGASVVITVRDHAEAQDTGYRQFPGWADPADDRHFLFSIPKAALGAERFQFAFGVKLDPEVYALNEPWREARSR